MDKTYNSVPVETSAQAYWKDQDNDHTQETLGAEKFYCLSMLPYPSGELHVGHVRNYTIGDAISRYQRAQGKNVFQPMGWDAFGLPAENAAIKHGVAPEQWTVKNIKTMRKVFDSLGFSFNWDREIKTCDPEYYRWEQWLFLQLYKKGLAYQKESMVNWDPVDNTVLANEQIVDGCGWRSGAPVERKRITQWFLKITDYAQELLDDLEKLEDWPAQVRTMQKNWIGRSEGYTIHFNVVNEKQPLDVFTTRLDTLMGASFIAIAADHPLALKAIEEDKALAQAVKKLNRHSVAESELATLDPEGVLSPFKATHPITRKRLPIWIANYVLSDYGTGAVMGVPAHDPRDHAMAKRHELPILPVVQASKEDWDYQAEAFTESGNSINSGEFDGLTRAQATKAIATELEKQHKAEKNIHFRLRDWGISRQRYWGTPIPMIHCKHCGVVPVPEEDLPVLLPTDLIPDGKTNPLKKCAEFYKTTCPQCGKAATRETDTMDTFVESSWYFARYCCANQHKSILDDRVKYWAPVDQYIGGVEHAVLHLLYARFFHKLLRDQGLVHGDEPFKKLLTQGMVLKDGFKMSKSKGNTVSPTALIKEYGADTLRLFILFAAPPSQSLEWSDNSVAGCHRYLKKLWQFCVEHKAMIQATNAKSDFNLDQLLADAPPKLQTVRAQLHQLLDQANRDYERLQFNTLVAACMKILNTLQSIEDSDVQSQAIRYEGISILLRLLAPMTPHIALTLWQELHFHGDIARAPWPHASTHAMKEETKEWVIQINGKTRAKIILPTDISDDELKKVALEDPKIAAQLEHAELLKLIVVPNKLLNIVAKQTVKEA